MTMDGTPARPALRGIAFPFRISEGGVESRAGKLKVADDLRHFLSTRLGERPMRRAYGSGIHGQVQEANDATVHALVRHLVEQGLRQHLPEVQLAAPLRITGREAELVIEIEYVANPGDMVQRLELRVP